MNATTTLQLRPRDTILSDGTMPEVVLGIGLSDLADTLFRHEPPTAIELEQAIDSVEDALTATGLQHAERGELLSADPRLHALLSLQAQDAVIGRDAVEALFDRLACASLGRPGLLDEQLAGRDAAAALLILRECMHHLGYDRVRRVAG